MSDINRADKQEPTLTKEHLKIMQTNLRACSNETNLRACSNETNLWACSDENPFTRLNMLIRELKDFCEHAEELKESFIENRNELYDWFIEMQDGTRRAIETINQISSTIGAELEPELEENLEHFRSVSRATR